MKIHYDPTTDLLTIALSSTPAASAEEVRQDLHLLLDSNGRFIGIEVHNARQRADLADLGIDPAVPIAPQTDKPKPAAAPSATDEPAVESTSHAAATIFTDGACLGNPGPGGWAARLKFPGGRIVEIGGSEPETTNNRMELLAAIHGLDKAGEIPAITLVTDSQYLRNGITKWIHGWKRRGWQTAAKKPVLNQDLWRRLDRLNGPHVTWKYTRGHAGDPDNERCDTIAQTFARGGQPALQDG